MKDTYQILVIEDNQAMRMLLSNFLSKSFDVISKSNGFEGMAWLSQGNIPDFIVLDYDMPQINGLEFLTNIRKSGFYQDIPVLILTAGQNQKNKDACSALGVLDFMEKPFDPRVLKKIIEDHLALSAKTIQ